MWCVKSMKSQANINKQQGLNDKYLLKSSKSFKLQFNAKYLKIKSFDLHCMNKYILYFNHDKLNKDFFMPVSVFSTSVLNFSWARIWECMYVRTNFGAAYNLHKLNKLTYGSEIWYMCSLAKYPGMFFSFF